MGPQPIVKVEVQVNVVPPAMVSSSRILSVLANPMEGVLGDLQLLVSVSSKGNEERGYLECHWIMSPSRRQGILFVAEMSDVAKEPTHGYRDCWPRLFPKGRSLDDWMLE